MRAAAAIGSEKHRVAAKISSGCASSLLCIVSVLIVLQLVSEVVMQAKQIGRSEGGMEALTLMHALGTCTSYMYTCM
jgi:hypothetical protein